MECEGYVGPLERCAITVDGATAKRGDEEKMRRRWGFLGVEPGKPTFRGVIERGVSWVESPLLPKTEEEMGSEAGSKAERVISRKCDD